MYLSPKRHFCEGQGFDICSLVIQVVSSTYEQIDNSGRISLVNGKQCSEPMGVLCGLYGGVGRP